MSKSIHDILSPLGLHLLTLRVSDMHKMSPEDVEIIKNELKAEVDDEMNLRNAAEYGSEEYQLHNKTLSYINSVYYRLFMPKDNKWKQPKKPSAKQQSSVVSSMSQLQF